MSYPQFGYSYSASSQLLVANNQASNPCCDASRPMVTDPLTGQTVCSCQYDSWTIGYSRLGTAGAIYSTSYGDQTYPSISIEPGPLYGPLANPYSIKESSGEMNGWSVSQPTTHYSYDMSAYGYGSYDLNGSRRKNATRETTSTLKAWLSEHKKNPYPTKGEKIMLAIITKMTLTQVSTWFANARRRLKKENKMTWEPKNKASDDGDDSSDGEDEITPKKNSDGSLIDGENQNDDLDDKSSDSIGSDLTNHKILDSSHSCAQLSSNAFPPTTVTPSKPKIWSLADTATCKTPPPPPAVAPFQSSPAWVPSVGAFQVPSLSHQSSAHGSRSCGGNYALELHASADTPPQTPPNLKVPASGNACHQETSISLYTPHRNILTSMTSRFPPSTGDVTNHIPQVCAPNSLYNATDVMNTAFKPVVKRENSWT